MLGKILVDVADAELLALVLLFLDEVVLLALLVFALVFLPLLFFYYQYYPIFYSNYLGSLLD